MGCLFAGCGLFKNRLTVVISGRALNPAAGLPLTGTFYTILEEMNK